MSKLFLSIGAGPGIGLSTARRFAAEGFDIVLAARDAATLESRAAELRRTMPTRVSTAVVDCASPSQVAALVDAHGADLQVLHYNAAVIRTQNLLDQTVGSVSDDLTVDVASGLVAARQAALAMVDRGSGTILFTGGGLAVTPAADLLTLSVGKAALRAATQALFPQLAARGVHIATLTIASGIAPDSPAAEAVAKAFWALHDQPRDAWHWEARFP